MSLGSFQELDEQIPLNCDKLVVDSWAQNAHRGELLKLVKAGRLTWSKCACGKCPTLSWGRLAVSHGEIICACIIGMGSTDIGIAGALYKENFADNNDPRQSLHCALTTK